MASIICLSVTMVFGQAAPVAAPATPAASAAATNTPVDENNYPITDSAQTPGSAAGIGGFGVWDLLRMVFILALVIAAIYGVFYVIRRGSRPKGAQSGLINVLGSQSLPGGQWVHLINVQKSVFIIGGGDGGINLIKEVTDQESIDELRLQASQNQPARSQNFADLLGGFFGAGAGKSGGGNGLDFIKKQRDRLKKYKE